ncbi:MAG: type II secretion system inner membrane protein GspF [Desulfohalobiaceae bacterium]|nr:type II secretion system inner membrane protein GspF [Desulfohalobiaceae bacterium]
MPVYEYTALDPKGREKKGEVNAETSRLALEKLRGRNLYPSHIQIVTSPGSKASQKKPKFSFLSRVNQGELVVVIRQLATLLSAGLPLAVCLDSVLEQARKGSLHRVFVQIRERVNSGTSLSAAFEEQGQVFPAFFAAMVKAGESSGTLELVLERLAEFSEQQQELKRKLQSSLAYPVLILLVSLGVIFFLMSYVVPKVSQIFLDFEQALPLPTLVLIQISDLLHHYWWLFPIAIVAAWVVFKRIQATPRGKLFLDRRVLQLPLIGPIVHSIVIGRFSHTLGTLLKNEVTLLQSLQIVRNVTGNTVLQQNVDSVINEVSQGSSVAKTMQKGEIFPATMIQLVAAGEKSGQLDTMFLKVAQTSEEYVTNKLAMLTSLLEPVMILVLGGIVGFVVLAVLLPIFDMSQLVQ